MSHYQRIGSSRSSRMKREESTSPPRRRRSPSPYPHRDREERGSNRRHSRSPDRRRDQYDYADSGRLYGYGYQPYMPYYPPPVPYPPIGYPPVPYPPPHLPYYDSRRHEQRYRERSSDARSRSPRDDELPRRGRRSSERNSERHHRHRSDSSVESLDRRSSRARRSLERHFERPRRHRHDTSIGSPDRSPSRARNSRALSNASGVQFLGRYQVRRRGHDRRSISPQAAPRQQQRRVQGPPPQDRSQIHCANCDQNHDPRFCHGPTKSGWVIVCPRCRSNRHPFESCPYGDPSVDDRDEFLYYPRQGLPPIKTKVDCSDIQAIPGRHVRPVWSCEFASWYHHQDIMTCQRSRGEYYYRRVDYGAMGPPEVEALNRLQDPTQVGVTRGPGPKRPQDQNIVRDVRRAVERGDIPGVVKSGREAAGGPMNREPGCGCVGTTHTRAPTQEQELVLGLKANDRFATDLCQDPDVVRGRWKRLKVPIESGS
ncbi:hypothetical protein F5B20DRAFT_581520 [Whalleya microplaca]|nr:hypothetical protein F5B20DRAFT_581520 [Whalleya microplaca]